MLPLAWGFSTLATLLYPPQLHFKDPCPLGYFALQAVIVPVEVQRPASITLLDSDKAFPPFEHQSLVLAGAVERACDVGLSIDPNTIFDFQCIFVDVDPIHDGRILGYGCNKAFVLGIGVREEVASAKMGVVFIALAGGGIDDEPTVSKDDLAVVD